MQSINYTNSDYYYPFSNTDQANALEKKDECWICHEDLVPANDVLDNVLDLFFKKEPPPLVYGHPHPLKNKHPNQDVILLDGLHSKCLKMMTNPNVSALHCGPCRLEIKNRPVEPPEPRRLDLELLKRREWKEKITKGIKSTASVITKIGIVYGGFAIGLCASNLGKRAHLPATERDLQAVDVRVLMGAGLGAAVGAGLTVTRQFSGVNLSDSIGKISTLFGSMGMFSYSLFSTMKIVSGVKISEESPTLVKTSFALIGATFAVVGGAISGYGLYFAGGAVVNSRRFIMPEIAELVFCGTVAQVGINKLIESEVAEPGMIQLAALAAIVGIAAKAARTAARSLKMISLWEVGANKMRVLGTGLALTSLAGVVIASGDTTLAGIVAGSVVVAVLGKMVDDAFELKKT